MEHHDDQDLIDMLDYRARQVKEKDEMIDLLKRQMKHKDDVISVLQQKYFRLRALMRGAPQPVPPVQNRVHSGGSLLAPPPPPPPRQHSGAVSLAPQQQPQPSGSSSSSSTVRIDGMQHSSVSLTNQIPAGLQPTPNVAQSSPFQALYSAMVLMAPSTRAEPNRVQMHYQPTSLITQPSTSTYYPDYYPHQQQQQSPINTTVHNNIQHNQELLNLNLENTNREVMENVIYGGEQVAEENAQFGTNQPQVDYGEEARITGEFGYARMVVIKPEDVKEEGEYETTNRNGTVIETIEVKDEDDDDYDEEYDEEEYEEEENALANGQDTSQSYQLIEDSSLDRSHSANGGDRAVGGSLVLNQFEHVQPNNVSQQATEPLNADLMHHSQVGGGGERDLSIRVETLFATNTQTHQPTSSLFCGPSTSTSFFNAPSHPPATASIGYEPENDPEILAEVKRGVTVTGPPAKRQRIEQISDEREVIQPNEGEDAIGVNEQQSDPNGQIIGEQSMDGQVSGDDVQHNPINATIPINHECANEQMATADNFVRQIEPDQFGNKFECDYEGCGKRSKYKFNLIIHIRSHTSEKPFKCNWADCDAKFTASDKLTHHRRTHTGEKPYECEWPGCGQAFSKPYSLTIHRRLHTGELPYACNVPDCGQALRSSTLLKYHSLAHSGERPFACDVVGCPKNYKNASGLRKHKNAVHN